MPSPGPKVNSSLQQIMDISSRLGLFLPNDAKINTVDSSGYNPIVISDIPTISPSLSAQQQKSLSNYNMEQDQKRKEKFNNITMGALGGLSLIDHLIPGEKSKAPVVRPLESYNPTPYGTGSQAIAKDGIYIKPSHRGLFTSEAKSHGMGVQEFASHVLSHKDQFSSAVVKRANFARNFGGRKADMGLTIGDPEDPKKKQLPVYQTQAEVDQANEFARAMARRQNLVNPNEYYVAKKPGDPVVQFLDINTGKPYNKPVKQIPASMVQHSVPDNITKLEWSPEWQMPYYKDDNDNLIYVDKQFFNSPRFIKSRQEQDQIIAMRNSKMKNGGKMKKGYKCEDGGLIEGQSYDLDPEVIKQLLNAGYQLDFE